MCKHWLNKYLDKAVLFLVPFLNSFCTECVSANALRLSPMQVEFPQKDSPAKSEFVDLIRSNVFNVSHLFKNDPGLIQEYGGASPFITELGSQNKVRVAVLHSPCFDRD